jgi:hypothetical protein
MECTGIHISTIRNILVKGNVILCSHSLINSLIAMREIYTKRQENPASEEYINKKFLQLTAVYVIARRQ